MKKYLFFVLFSIFSHIAIGQNFYEIISGGTKTDIYTGATLTDNGYVLCGYTNSNAIGRSFMLLQRFDYLANLLWTKTYGNTTNGLVDRAHVVIQTRDKGFLLGGFGYGADGCILKTDSDGNVLWSKLIGESYTDSVMDVKETPDKGFVMTGVSRSNMFTSLCIVKMDSVGTVLWKHSYRQYFDSGKGYSVIVTSDGNYLAVGTAPAANGQAQCYAIKVDVAGNTLWEKVYGGNVNEKAFSVTELAGNYYLLCEAQCNTYNYGLMKISPAGNLLWAKCIEHPNINFPSYPKKIISLSDSTLLLTGNGPFPYLSISRSQMLLIKADKNGQVLWASSYGDSARIEESNAVLEMPDRTLLIAGYSQDYDANQPPQLYQVHADSNGYIGCTSYHAHPNVTMNLSYTQASVPSSYLSGTNIVLRAQATYTTSSVSTIYYQCQDAVGVEDPGNNSRMEIYPNPSSASFRVKITSPDLMIGQLEIYDSFGRKILATLRPFPANGDIDLSDQPDGIYFVKITTSAGVFAEKLVLRR